MKITSHNATASNIKKALQFRGTVQWEESPKVEKARRKAVDAMMKEIRGY